jgi:hypothetical protein
MPIEESVIAFQWLRLVETKPPIRALLVARSCIVNSRDICPCQQRAMSRHVGHRLCFLKKLDEQQVSKLFIY